MKKPLPDRRSPHHSPSRLNQIDAALRRLPVDIFISRHLPQIRYVTGFTGSKGLLILSTRGHYLLVDGRYLIQAKQECPGVEIRETQSTFEESAAGMIRELQGQVVGFESEKISAADFCRLRHRCPRKVRWVPLNDWLEMLRSIKDRSEIDHLRKVAKLASDACHELAKWIQPGMRELDVVAELEYWLRKKGAERLSFDPIVASGIRSAWPHARATIQKIPEKGWVLVDFGAMCDGYSSDITRTFYLGRPKVEELRRFRILKEAQSKALDSLQVGIQSDHPYRLVKKHLERYGLSDYFQHGLGHGIGLELHERPSLSLKNSEPILENMIFTVEPGIYIPGEGGMRLEDMVLLKDTGIELLTDFSRDLIML